MRTGTICLAVSMAVGLAASAQAPSDQGEFANVKELGRAVRQYQDATLHVVVAYKYSEQRHDSRWILIEMAVASNRRMIIHRNGVFLRTPDGRVIDLASQQRFGEDSRRITSLIQSASVTRHAVESYSNLRNEAQRFVFFAQPFQGLVSDDFMVGNNRVMVGDLFFENPRGLWDKGVHALTIQGDQVRAELPISLD